MLELNSSVGRMRDENPRKKTPALWVALVKILFIWRLKVKCKSTSISRLVTEDVLVSWDPLMKYGWGIIDLDLWWMYKTLHLLILIDV